MKTSVWVGVADVIYRSKLDDDRSKVKFCLVPSEWLMAYNINTVLL